MKIAVCDDEQIYVERICCQAKKECEALGLDCEVSSFHSGETILEAVKNNQYDLILLDIRMPEVNGFDVAVEVYRATNGDNLVFVSSEEHLACASIEFRPFGFVRKRCLDEELHTVFKRWYEHYSKKKVISFTYGHDKEQMHLRLDDIMYIEAAGHYVTFHTKDNAYDKRAHISELDYLLENKELVKCSRSFICNLKHVMSKTNEYFIMSDGKKISIGRTCRSEVWEAYNAYLRYEYLGE